MAPGDLVLEGVGGSVKEKLDEFIRAQEPDFWLLADPDDIRSGNSEGIECYLDYLYEWLDRGDAALWYQTYERWILAVAVFLCELYGPSTMGIDAPPPEQNQPGDGVPDPRTSGLPAIENPYLHHPVLQRVVYDEARTRFLLRHDIGDYKGMRGELYELRFEVSNLSRSVARHTD